MRKITYNGTPDVRQVPRPRMEDGDIIPDGIAYQLMLEEKEKTLRKQSRRHDYRVALFSAAIGGVFGFAASLLYDFITSI